MSFLAFVLPFLFPHPAEGGASKQLDGAQLPAGVNPPCRLNSVLDKFKVVCVERRIV